jgi:hypothetical protein
MHSLQIIQAYQAIAETEDAIKEARTDLDLLLLHKRLTQQKLHLDYLTQKQAVRGAKGDHNGLRQNLPSAL